MELLQHLPSDTRDLKWSKYLHWDSRVDCRPWRWGDWVANNMLAAYIYLPLTLPFWGQPCLWLSNPGQIKFHIRSICMYGIEGQQYYNGNSMGIMRHNTWYQNFLLLVKLSWSFPEALLYPMSTVLILSSIVCLRLTGKFC